MAETVFTPHLKDWTSQIKEVLSKRFPFKEGGTELEGIGHTYYSPSRPKLAGENASRRSVSLRIG